MNTFGREFRITTFGESHGKAVGVVVDGVPAGLPLSEEDVKRELERRMCVVVLALLAVALAALLGTLPLYVRPYVEKPQMDTAIYATAETPGATLYNLAVFFTLLVVATAAIYLLLTRRRLLSLFLYFVWFTLALGVVQFYAWLYYSYGILPPGPATWAILLSPAVGVLVVFLLSRRRGDLFLGFLGALAGSMFVWILPSVTVLALLVALPVYDYLMSRVKQKPYYVTETRSQLGLPI